MNLKRVNLSTQTPILREDSLIIQDAVKSGAILVYPTDTIYGLGCNALLQDSVNEVARIKNRNASQPFSLHIATVEEIEQYALIETDLQRAIIQKLLPGPHTLILNANQTAPKTCISDEGKIGIRVPDSKSFKKFYQIANLPLIGTSINKSSEPPINQPNAIPEEFLYQINLIASTDEILSGASSNVIDITFDPPLVKRGTLPDTIGL